MDTLLANMTYAGGAVYIFYILTSIWIIAKKNLKLLSIIFPILALLEGLFIDWRWSRIQDYGENTQIVLGALPSFIISIGLPFIGFYIHHLITQNLRQYFRENNLFPFAKADLQNDHIRMYFNRGLVYSFVTLALHEFTQMFNISSRNTFDYYDMISIVIGSIISLLVFQLIKPIPRK